MYICIVNEWIKKTSHICETSLPGWEAQKKLINYDRPAPKDFSKINPKPKLSGVLALLYPKNNELYTVLTLRNSYNGVHSNQVSFPGGKKETVDVSLWDTALREAREEVGLHPEKIFKIGELTHVYIPPSKFLVAPFLAYTDEEPQFIADPYEVKRIIETPVSVFLNDSNIRQKDMFIKAYNTSIPIKYYDVNGNVVWGATAMMLSEIADILKKVASAPIGRR